MDPFELHPEDKSTLKNNLKSVSITADKLRYLIEIKLNKIKKEQTPTWGYSTNHIESFLFDLLEEVVSNVEDNDDR